MQTKPKPKRLRAKLKTLRNDAPPQDRELPALKATVVRYVPTYALSTLPELEAKLGWLGAAVVAEVQWSAIVVWLMKGADAATLSNPGGVVAEAVYQRQRHDRVALGLPSLGLPPIDGLSLLSADVQAEVHRVANETLADWRAAGCPYLTPQRIDSAYCTYAPYAHTKEPQA